MSASFSPAEGDHAKTQTIAIKDLSATERQELIATLSESDDAEALRLAASLTGGDPRQPHVMTIFRKLRRLFPEDDAVRMRLHGLARELCDYAVLAEEETLLRADLQANRLDWLSHEPPHASILWLEDEALNRHATAVGPLPPVTAESRRLRNQQPHAWGERLRIGYLSADFWDDHATMRLLRSVLTSHDARHVETTLFCYTPANLKAYDSGGRTEWGRIVTLDGLDDASAAAAIRAEGIDILVDLKGHTSYSRSRLMNDPLAPVHVAWLGFPGSVVGVDCDYVIGDRFVLPDAAAAHYHEAFCRLPESYQPNDPYRRPLPPAVSRLALGLPADRVVLAAFNSQRKNSLETLAVWAAVLRDNPDALLWLMVDGAGARKTTASEFKRLGIKQSQLLFAPKMAYSAHIARVQAADIALDTLPCNGHTTTSDMLWAGLPVVTRRGHSFAARVSESLLNAIGLPDLVAQDNAGFVSLAGTLIRSRQRRDDLCAALNARRFTSPLFDAERFCRHLEQAYRTMADRARRGDAPEAFDVPALPPRDGSFQRR